VRAASLAQREFVAVLDGDTRVLDTTGGKVLLDLRPLVLRLGDRFSFIPNLEEKVPPGKAQITILESDQLSTAQNLTKALRFAADWIWVLALGAWAVAIWLARGRRRIELRAMAIGLIVAGFVVLVARTLAGRYFVDNLVASDSVKPAAENAFDILTGLLRGAGWTAVIIGVVGLVGVWLAGPGRRATSSRRWLAPYLRRPEIAYGGLLLGYLLLLWWKPTPQFSFVLDVVVFLALALLGLEALRRLTAREYPDAQQADVVAAVMAAASTLRPSRPPGAPSTSEELERLGRLRAEGVIDDAEFTAAKASLLGTRVPTEAPAPPG
jgi:hypothetical protein